MLALFGHAGLVCRRPFSKEHRTRLISHGATWLSGRVTPWAHDMRSKIAVRQFAGAVVDRVQFALGRAHLDGGLQTF